MNQIESTTEMKVNEKEQRKWKERERGSLTDKKASKKKLIAKLSAHLFFVFECNL